MSDGFIVEISKPALDEDPKCVLLSPVSRTGRHRRVRGAGGLPRIAVHDGWTPYRRYEVTHQLCWAPPFSRPMGRLRRRTVLGRGTEHVTLRDPRAGRGRQGRGNDCATHAHAQLARSPPRRTQHCGPRRQLTTHAHSPARVTLANQSSQPRSPPRHLPRGRRALRYRLHLAIRQQPRRTRSTHGATTTENFGVLAHRSRHHQRPHLSFLRLDRSQAGNQRAQCSTRPVRWQALPTTPSLRPE